MRTLGEAADVEDQRTGRPWRSRAVFAVAGVVAGAALAGGGLALADSESVDLCAGSANGALRLDSGDGCRPNEDPLTITGGTSAFSTRIVMQEQHLGENTTGYTVSAYCDDGEVLTGGGADVGELFFHETYVVDDAPAFDDSSGTQGWTAHFRKAIGPSGSVHVYAICAPGVSAP